MSNKSDTRDTPPIAIAHDYLTQRGGAERVVLALHKAFPEAPIYTTLYNPETTYPEFKDCTVIVSPLNRVALFRKDHRLALPLLPFFSSRLKVRAERAVVSTTGWAHGFDLPAESYIYCHSPARWVYLTDQYLGDSTNPLVSYAFKILRPFLKRWDQKAASRQLTRYVANSTTIRQRIADVYGQTVPIIFPPFSVTGGGEQESLPGLEDFMREGYYLIVSRLLPYKNIQHAVAAFTGLNQKLLVIGAGPMLDELKANSGSNVAFASNISDAQMRYAYAHATAVLAVSYEDFGITPLESGALGKPVIALRAGGFLDTIKEGVNGTFIEAPTAEAIRAAVLDFKPEVFSADVISQHIDRFSESRFIAQVRDWAGLDPELQVPQES